MINQKMETVQKVLKIETGRRFQVMDITNQVDEILYKSWIKSGLINIQSLHTTVGIIVNENDLALLQDFKSILQKTVPADGNFQHSNNGQAHCQAMLLPSSVTLGVEKGKIVLGKWQRILLIELDEPRTRQIAVNIIGED